MNRLSKTLTDLKENNQKALVAYLVAGDPDINSTIELMKLFVESGVDVIEIGVPFTDPIAEGPIIQKAHDRALKNNISLESIFNMVSEFRKHDDKTPLVLMGYLNTFIFYKKLIEEKIISLSRYLNLDDQTFEGFMSWILYLREELSIPHTLKELIQDESKFEEMSKMAKDDPSTGGNPIPLEINDFYNLYKDSYSGIL